MTETRDTYRTPADRGPTLLTRISPWPEIPFYARILGAVTRASVQASTGRYDDETWIRSSEGILRILEGAGVRVEAEGLERLARVEGPVVFVGNHMSTLETFVLPFFARSHVPLTFVVKESLLRYPLFGPVMRSRDPVAVGRENPREDLTAVLRGGAERLARGISVVVFPQTTRTVRFEPARFNSIGAKLAARAGVPLVPVALRTDAWGNGGWIKDFGRIDPSLPVRFRFGAPLAPEGKGNQAHAAVMAFLRETLGAWGVEVGDAPGGGVRP